MAYERVRAYLDAVRAEFEDASDAEREAIGREVEAFMRPDGWRTLTEMVLKPEEK